MSALNELFTAKAEEKSSSSKKPSGSVKLTIQGNTIFTRNIWKESTSDNQLQGELNQICLEDKAKATEVFKKLLPLMEVEITGAGGTSVSLADLLK